MKHILRGAIIWLCILSVSAQAADIAGDVQSGLNLNEDGGYLEIGFAAGYIHFPYQVEAEKLGPDALITAIDSSGVLRKNGFFLEGVQATQDGLNLGYNLFQNEKWSLDILGANLFGLYIADTGDGRIRGEDDEATRNRKLVNRNTLYAASGFRVTQYFDKYVAQYRLVTDLSGSNGVSGSLRIGRGWQVRNWNLFGIASANYSSKKANNFYYQVEPHEATTKYPAYDSDSSLSYSLQFGMVKPLSEKWLIRFYGGWVQFPDEARDSPLSEDSDATYVAIAINRVFSWGL